MTSDATTGVPIGLEGNSTKYTKLPARGVTIRVYQQLEETSYDDATGKAWVYQGGTNTDESGAYSLTVAGGYKTFVEVVSSAKFFDATGAISGQVYLFAEPGGPSDPTPEVDRAFYTLRKGLDGTSQTSPTVLPGTQTTATTATVNFDIGLNDPWWISPKKNAWTDFLLSHTPNIAHEGAGYASNPGNPGTGSRVLAILDSAYTFANNFGNTSPNAYALDLHYLYNCNDTQTGPQYSYVDYDLASYPTKYPQAFDGSSYHYFGYVQGGTLNDDAFDEGVLFPLLAKNWLLYKGGSSLDPFLAHRQGDPAYLQDLQDLRPDLAMLEGFSPAIAASLLRSPYLADTTGVPGGGLNPAAPYRDIRDTTGLKRDAFSAPGISALSWAVILKANSVANSAGPVQWATIDPLVTYRFFYRTDSYTNITAVINDVPNIFHQLSRLQEDQSSTETVDLQAIFTDSALTTLLTPYNIPWPRPTTVTAPSSPYLSFMPLWDSNPDSLVKPLPTLTLSMANARKDNNTPEHYPNVSWWVDDPMHPTQSKGEVCTAVFSLTQDTVYDLSLNTSPAIPANATVEVILGAANTSGAPVFGSGTTYSFGASSPSQHYRVTLGMEGVGVYNKAYFPVMVRLVSPDVQQPSDLSVTVNLLPAH